MAGFDNDIMFAQGSDVGVFPNTSDADNSTEFSRSGSDVLGIVKNTSNTADSGAAHLLEVGGTSAGDPYYKWLIGTSHSWAFGIDNTAAQTVIQLGYRNDADANPSNTTNLPLRCVATNTVTGESNTIMRSVATVAEESTGVCRLEVNSNNSAGVDAFVQMIQTNGTDDVRQQYAGGNGSNWFTGTDGSAGSDFYLTNAAVGAWPPTASNTIMKVFQAGEVTLPLTPAFLAYLAASDANVTGAGTAFTLGSANALTEVFDQGGDFNTNGTFTAPVTGRYQFHSTITVEQITAAMTFGQILVVTSNRTYQGLAFNAAAVRGASIAVDVVSFLISCMADMDAADTAVVQIQIFSGAGDTADVNGVATNTFFSGMLAA